MNVFRKSKLIEKNDHYAQLISNNSKAPDNDDLDSLIK